jgi:hypothetical protein
MRRKVFEKPLLLSPATNNSFSISDKFADTSFEVEFEEFIMGAKEYKSRSYWSFIHEISGSGDDGRDEHFLKEGEVQNIHNVLFSLNKPTDGAINIVTSGDGYTKLRLKETL